MDDHNPAVILHYKCRFHNYWKEALGISDGFGPLVRRVIALKDHCSNALKRAYWVISLTVTQQNNGPTDVLLAFIIRSNAPSQ